MSLPGPDGILWPLELLVFAASFGVVGEAVRQLLARYAPLLATVDPFERAIVDLYLGGAVVYLIAWLPPGLFYAATLPVVVLASVLGLWVASLRREPTSAGPYGIPIGFHIGWRSVALIAALLLFGIEVVAAEGAPTGNTYDSGLFTAYNALLIAHHSLPTSLLPIVNQPLPYPQGATVWFASAQLLFGLPPARTAVLVTPLFFGLVPIAGFVLGRRWFARESGGAAVALSLALLASWTRVMVSGSNDFVLAFPLALLLFAWLPGWWRPALPGWGSTLAFGLITGCLATLNPVGAEVVVAGAVIGRMVVSPGLGRGWGGWSARWGISTLVSAACVAPNLVIEVTRVGSGVAGTGSAAIPYGVSAPQLVGLLDPFLFRPSDVGLSPFPWLRFELVILLGVGSLLLIRRALSADPQEAGPGPGTASLAIGAAAVAGLLLEGVSVGGNPLIGGVARLSSPSELSVLLFTAFSLVAAVPLAGLFQVLERGPSGSTALRPPGLWRWERSAPETRGVALAVSALLLLPGVAITATSFPPYLTEEYRQFGNVTAGDFALLGWASSNLPAGARVLAAPGSAAQFLPGYDEDVALLFPVTLYGESTNADYQHLLGELSAATLDPSGVSALNDLGVEYVAITQANNVLWPPFSPLPFETEARASLLFHSGDAYVFQWASPGPTASPSL
ncbi:MAG: hypothetical protein L3K19_01645 [Thermoplasmata archaeon]|nr:hypothetical protein [Thermoplasmata archaeon]